MRQAHHITYATVLYSVASGATWACSGDPGDPGDPQISVFYANVRSHEGIEAPAGTAIVTWLSPGTVGEVDSTGWPSGGLVVGYLPGFLTVIPSIPGNRAACASMHQVTA